MQCGQLPSRHACQFRCDDELVQVLHYCYCDIIGSCFHAYNLRSQQVVKCLYLSSIYFHLSFCNLQGFDNIKYYVQHVYLNFHQQACCSSW